MVHILKKILPNPVIGRIVMRKRNKKTTIVSKMELCGLTEYILAGMGEEGKVIRARLMRFLAERTVHQPSEVGKAGVELSGEIS